MHSIQVQHKYNSRSPVAATVAHLRSCTGLKRQVGVCRGLTLKAYEVWAGWVAKGLRMELQAALQSDAALKSSTPLQAWEETIITQVASCPSHLAVASGSQVHSPPCLPVTRGLRAP